MAHIAEIRLIPVAVSDEIAPGDDLAVLSQQASHAPPFLLVERAASAKASLIALYPVAREHPYFRRIAATKSHGGATATRPPRHRK